MFQRSDIHEGMMVRSMDGENLGRVFALRDDEFLIEKGLFFPKDYVCRYSEISDIRNEEIILLHGREGLHRFTFGESPPAPIPHGDRAEEEHPPLETERPPQVDIHRDGAVEGTRELSLSPDEPKPPHS